MGNNIIGGARENVDGLKKMTSFSAKQVSVIKERFEMLCDEDLSLDKTKMQKVLKISSAECDAFMQFFDLDQSGKVDSYEFVAGLALLSNSSLDDKLDILFDLYDFDKSGVISKDELIILLKTVASSLAAMTQTNSPSITEIEKKANELLMKWDTNKDGVISQKEFRSLMTKDADIVKCLQFYDILSQDDLRDDFGGNGADAPECDSDLENELKRDVDRDDRHVERKAGLEMNVKEDENGDFVVDENRTGDQFLAVKPFQSVIQNGVPTDYKPNKADLDAPEAQLKLDYIFGYRSFDTRNNLKYLGDTGRVVYHTAAVGITLTPKSNDQQFFLEHNDDIICLASYGKMIATGQIGKNPLLCIWDAETMEALAIIQGTLDKGITNVCFSKDGTKLAAISMDENHTVAIYDIDKLIKQKKSGQTVKNPKTEGLLAVGKGPSAGILDLKFDPADGTLIAACVKELSLISFDGGRIKVSKGSWGKQTQQALNCIEFLDKDVVTGGFSGNIFVWRGKAISTAIKAHESSVNALAKRGDVPGIISGGNDGVVIVWDASYKKVTTINIKAQNISQNPKIRALDQNRKGDLLVGTRGGEILEFPAGKAGTVTANVLMKGHFDAELWGLATHPSKNEFITAGQDSLVAIWDPIAKKQIRSTKIDYEAACAAYSSKGDMIAVGCRNGFVLLIEPATLTIKTIFKDRTKEISVVKFSPNGSYLAVGSEDSEIFLYNLANNNKITKIRGHHSRILHIDFTVDGTALQSQCTSYELLYFEVATGKRLTAGATKFKDEKWSSWTLPIGWHTQGIWPPCSDGSDINAVDRAHEGNVMATADDFGKVKLFKFPSPAKNANHNKYLGHSAHVTNVSFTAKDDFLISTGGNDKSIMIWRYSYDKAGEEEVQHIHAEVDEAALEENEGEEELFEQEEVKDGDQALAVKAFLGQVKASAPRDFKMPPQAGEAPNANLVLKYVHGYRCFDGSTNMVKFSSTGKVVFGAAALGVVMEPTSLAQTFFQVHEEDIVSLAIHPKGTIAATGQMAQKGKAKLIDLYVWDIESKQKLANLNKCHLRAILALAFSPSGSKLLSVGGDDDYTLAINDWATSRLISTAKTDKAKITGVAWSTENNFVTVGVKHVKFWTLSGSNLNSSRGTLGETKAYPILSVTYAFTNNSVCVTGCNDGSLIPWTGNSPGKGIAAHKGGVSALLAYKNNLFSGGNDGKVILWTWGSSGPTKSAEFADVAKFTSFPSAVRSIDCRVDNKILIGTRGGEVMEVSKAGQVQVLLQGHYEGELWGLAWNKNNTKYATCGGDKTVRVWDSQKNKMLASAQMSVDCRSVDWSSDGKYIVVGDSNGLISLLNPDTLAVIDKLQSSFKDKGQWIEEIKFSPNSQMIGFGAHRGRSNVEIMAIKSGKLAKQGVINVGLTSALLHLDWSSDSGFVVVNSQAYELKFISISAGKDIAASAAKDIDWSTWTCKIGWPVQGIWQGVDYTDVNTVCRSNDKKIVATGDDFGKVNLFKYPCVVEKAKCKAYIGHSSHVTRVRLSADDDTLVSVGGNDKCVLVWKTDFGRGQAEEQGGEEEEDVMMKKGDDDLLDDSEFVHEKKQKSKPEKAKAVAKPVDKDEDNLFEIEEAGHGDEFMAVKPWLGAIKEPSTFKKTPVNQEKPPAIKLELEYVHGYRAKDCRNNLKYLKNGNLVYNAAALGIVMEIDTNTQSFFNKHTDDITAIEVHPDGVTVATGELGPKPVIYIWNSDTMQVLFALKGGVIKGIATLSFSLSGAKLAAACIDDNHMVAVFDMKIGGLEAVEKGDTAIISELRFKDDRDFVTVGPKHFKVWSVDNKAVKSKKGVFNGANNLLLTCAFNNEDCLVGASNGELQIWKGNSHSKSLPIHKAALDALSVDVNYILTGGRDSVINILDRAGYSIVLSINCADQLKSSRCPRPKSLMFSRDNKSLLIGTFGAEIYEISTKDSKLSKGTKFNSVKEIIRGHYTPNMKWTNEVWGLAVYHDGTRYATCSDDGTLRIWSISNKKLLQVIDINTDLKGNPLPPNPKTKDLDDAAKGRTVDISPDDSFIAVGCYDGTIRIINGKSFETTTLFKHRNKWIADVKFSPNGEYLAVGSHDSFIDIYMVPSFKKKYSLKKHSAYITHLDWSENSNNLQSNCGGYDYLFWDISSGQQMPGGASALRDEKWASWTCVLGWPVQGIWPPTADGTDINAVARSTNQHPGGYHLLASADDKSLVKVFRYPCIKKGSEFVTGRGHSSHVTTTRWSYDDQYIFSTGGEDNCVFQWKVSNSK